VTRDLYLYPRVKPSGDAKKFIDFVLSEGGQSLATQVGYFPVR
jgi:phosphate transport system substrate-binding protein